MSVPPSVVATLGPDVPQPSLDQAGTRPTQTLPASPPTVDPAARPGQARLRPKSLIRSGTDEHRFDPAWRVATLSPDPTQLVVDRAGPIMPPGRQGVTVPILNPGPARHARSLGDQGQRQRSPGYGCPTGTRIRPASIISLPRSARTWVDAGAVAHASLHRARADRSAVPSPAPAPSAPWTLPPALAPTD